MTMRLHELHPSIIHGPLALLPAAAVVDMLAATSDRHLRRLAYDEAGKRLWWLGVGSALAAGLAGMAASQEVKVEEGKAKDAMFVHGFGNFLILLGGLGLASWRTTHRATITSGLVGLSAFGAVMYTAYLGGEIVYAHGVGVKAMAAGAPHGVSDSPPLLSREAPGRFLRDAASGLGWLFSRAAAALSSRERVRREAVTPSVSVPAGAGPEVRPELRH